MFNDEEIKAAKATRDALRNGNMPEELKSVYMAGEICMWDELGRPSTPKEPEAVHGNEAEKVVCDICGCHPSVIYKTQFGTFCVAHVKY